jgi:hypothetical protein
MLSPVQANDPALPGSGADSRTGWQRDKLAVNSMVEVIAKAPALSLSPTEDSHKAISGTIFLNAN